MTLPWPSLVAADETLLEACSERGPRILAMPTVPLPVSAVLFELSGVLYDASLWRRWLFQLVLRIGLQTHYATFFRCWDAEFQEDVNAGRCTYWQAMRQYLRAAGLSCGQIDEIEAAGRSRQQQFEREARPLPGVIQTLMQLQARGHRLTLLINAPLGPRELQERLSRLQLLGRFEQVFLPHEWAAESTAADRFRRAATTLRLAPREMAFVGHEARVLAAAAEAGMSTVAFNCDADAAAHLYIDQFDQLLQHLPTRVQFSRSAAA